MRIRDKCEIVHRFKPAIVTATDRAKTVPLSSPLLVYVSRVFLTSRRMTNAVNAVVCVCVSFA